MEDPQKEDFNADVEANRRLEEDLNDEHDGGPFASEAEEDLEIEAVKAEEESRQKYPPEY